MREPVSEDFSGGATPDARLADALRPAVDAALRRSIRDEPQTWTESFFPILLPAIRMAVASALRDMVQTLNQVLEHSLSLRSWSWRLEAWRTGKSFAEVALLRTLVYRVEQVLLIDVRTGLLLASASSNGPVKDPELVSAMLTAIQEFLHDSFEVEGSAGIREMHIGDLSLWVEHGPLCVLAAAIRGNAPVELRETLRAAVDLVHQEFGHELRSFRGDSAPFEPSRLILEGCLQTRLQTKKKRSYWRVWLLAAALLAGLVVWAAPRLDEARRWNRAVEAIGHTPGITLTSSGRESGRYVIEGLSDPLAAPPMRALRANGIDPANVSLRLRPFLSLEPEMVLERARATLEAPPSVSVSLEGDTVILAGRAPHGWMLHLHEHAAALRLAGVRTLRTDQLEDSGLADLRAQLEAARITFEFNSGEIEPDQRTVISMLAAQARMWMEGEIALGNDPRIEVIGSADPSGIEQRNLPLSRERAWRVASALAAQGVPRARILQRGEGSKLAAPDPRQARVVMLRTSRQSGNATP